MTEWRCPRCGRGFGARNAKHSCNSKSPSSFFAPYPAMVATFERVRGFLESLGDVEVEATKTQVAFRAQRRFAFLWIPAMALKRGPPELYLGIDLPRRVRSDRVKEAVEPTPGLWTHHIRLDAPNDVDGEVKAWLVEAYETRGLRPARGRTTEDAHSSPRSRAQRRA